MPIEWSRECGGLEITATVGLNRIGLISGCDAATRILSAEKIQNSFQLFKYSSKKKKSKKQMKVKSIFHHNDK